MKFASLDGKACAKVLKNQHTHERKCWMIRCSPHRSLFIFWKMFVWTRSIKVLVCTAYVIRWPLMCGCLWSEDRTAQELRNCDNLISDLISGYGTPKTVAFEICDAWFSSLREASLVPKLKMLEKELNFTISLKPPSLPIFDSLCNYRHRYPRTPSSRFWNS